MTASPLPSLEKNKNNKTANIQDLEENLILLCQNLDAIFLDYDQNKVSNFLNEAKSSVLEFPNDDFLAKAGGEVFLKYIENHNSNDGNFEQCLSYERISTSLYSAFKNKILKSTNENSQELSSNFKEIVQEVDDYLKKKTLRILHELGFIIIII